MLESAKLTFSRVGVHTMEGHVGNMYMPRIVLRIQGRKSAKIGYLMPDRFDRKDYIGLALLPVFIVVITKNEYIVVDEKAEERKAISRDEAGEIVGVPVGIPESVRAEPGVERGDDDETDDDDPGDVVVTDISEVGFDETNDIVHDLTSSSWKSSFSHLALARSSASEYSVSRC